MVKTLPANAGDSVWTLVREDPTCREATKPVRPNYWACALEPAHHNYWSPCALGPACHNYWAHVLQLLKPVCLEPMLCNKRSHHNEAVAMHIATKSSPRLLQLEKARVQQRRPNAAKIWKKRKKKKKFTEHFLYPCCRHLRSVCEKNRQRSLALWNLYLGEGHTDNK